MVGEWLKPPASLDDHLDRVLYENRIDIAEEHLTMTNVENSIFMGLDVVIEKHMLPMVPSDRENARRYVRHAYGTGYVIGPLGPEPGAVTHAIRVGKTLYVSQDAYNKIRRIDAGPFGYNHLPPVPEYGRKIRPRYL